jgi:hypothetical protein
LTSLQPALIALLLALMVVGVVIQGVASVPVKRTWFWRIHFAASVVMLVAFGLSSGVRSMAFLVALGSLALALWFTARIRYCECGATIPPQGIFVVARFCQNCGASLEDARRPSEPPRAV